MSAADGGREEVSSSKGGLRHAAGKLGARVRAALFKLSSDARGVSPGGVLDWLRRQRVIETDARSGFFMAPAAMMMGIAVVYGLGLRPPLWLAATVALLGLGLAVRFRDGEVARPFWLSVGFLCVGVALSGMELSRVSTTTFSGEATVRIEGRVVWRDRDERGRDRYLVEIERTERPVLSRPPERVRILVSSRHEPLAIGSRYTSLVRLRAPSGPAFPGAYDFAFGSHFDRLGAYGFGLGPPDPPDPRAGPSSLTVGERLPALRLSIGERIRDAVGGPEGAVAAALITGDRAGIPDEIDEWLRTTGLSHVLSISGLHMALVAGFAMVTVRSLLAAVPWCALVLPIKKIAAVAALLVATFYLLISGSNVATDRSYIMLSIMLLAVLFDRPALTLRNVAIAAMVVLALSPHAMTTASFQMSFAATAAMIGAYAGYARRREADGGRAERGPVIGALVFVAGLGLTSLIAGIATAPYSAYHFQRVQPFGLVANMIALPLFSLWIMPLALISMVAMPFGLDGPFLVLMGYGLAAVFEIARFLHDRLADAPTGLLTATGLVVLSLALVTGAFLSSALRWIALPLAAIGLALSPDRNAPPELLVFEDGKEIALVDAAGRLRPLREKPNEFVFSQWQRAFPKADSDAAAPSGTASSAAFACRIIQPEMPDADRGAAQPAPGTATPSSVSTSSGPMSSATRPAAPGPQPAAAGTRKPARAMRYCTATTRGGLKVVWTDDYRETGRACDEADIAIVARAVRLDRCLSGTILVTLRTLRRTGSLAVSSSPDLGMPLVARAIGEAPDEWNVHRHAAWPEFWRKPVEADRVSPDPAAPSKDDPG